jgi:hypothetical protein
VVNSFGNLTPQKDRGAIVIGGVVARDGPDRYVLTALDPTTGLELPNARRSMTVASVLYSGTGDLWYVFESGVESHFFPLPTDPFYVHAMQLDPVSGTWTELAAAAIPPALSYSTTAMLTDRIAYVAYAGGRSDQLELVILDTSVPSAIHVSATVPVAIPPVTLLGVRASSSNLTQRVVLCSTAQPRRPADAGAATEAGAGVIEAGSDPADAGADADLDDGAANLPDADDEATAPESGAGAEGGGDAATADATGSAGTGDAGGGSDAGGNGEGGNDAGSPPAPATNSATLTEYFVSSSAAPSPQATINVPQIGPLVGFATVTPSENSPPRVLVIARPVVSPQSIATLTLVDPVNLSTTAGTFPFNDFNVQPPAFSPCDNLAFVVGTNLETSIHAIDVNVLLGGGSGDGGTPSLPSISQSTYNSGQGLYFEPYTKTVLAPFSQGTSFTLTAFAVGRTGDGQPQLTQRSSWQPPADLRPNFVATKTPVPFSPALCQSPGQ